MRPINRIAAIIPAAGDSSRMGKLKPLLPLGELTAVEIAVKLFREAGIQEIRVVVGHAFEKIVPVLDRRRVKWVLNENYRSGMLSSIIAGVRDLEPELAAFFLLPVDVPLVRAKTVEAILEAWQKSRKSIIHPRFHNRRGHPPLISTRLISADIDPAYPGGMRELLRKYENDALDVDVSDEAILMNCNTPEDYRGLIGVGL